MNYMCLMVAVVIFRKDAEGGGIGIADHPLIFYEANQTAYQKQMIRVRIINGDEMVSFLMDSADTTAELYRSARSFGMLSPLNDTVLWEYSGRIIPNGPSRQLPPILTPPSLPSLKMPRELILYVFAMDQIEITVHITNGDITKSFVVNAATKTDEIYQKAVDIGIMDNFYQFLLRYQYATDPTFVPVANHSTRAHTLLDSIDLSHPNELSLIVSPIPEGVLLYRMFQDMTPNQNIPSWNYAQFCIRNPWHVLCSSLSRRIQYEDNVHPEVDLTDIQESKQKVENQTEDSFNDIDVLNVPTWSGILHLEHIPPSTRSMVLKGASVTLNFQTLRFSSLKELTLDFDEIIGLDIGALSGSSLEVLRLPSHSGLPEEEVADTLAMLNSMRAQEQTQLGVIDFGGGWRKQRMIWYNPRNGDYDYFYIGDDCIGDSPTNSKAL